MKKLLAVLTFTLCASAAHAEPPASSVDQDAVTALVQKVVLAPRAKADAKRSKFSRAMPVPAQRRVRVLSGVAEHDGRGHEFIRFAIDERAPFDEEGAWHEGRIVGCVYMGTRKVFVQRGDSYVPAPSRSDSDARAQPGVCQNAAQASTSPSERAGQRS